MMWKNGTSPAVLVNALRAGLRNFEDVLYGVEAPTFAHFALA
jgi:hypothetical protein